MEVQEVNIQNMAIKIPAYYQRVDSMPDDPENSVPYMFQTENALCFALIYPISESKAMHRDQDAVIRGIRQCMGDNQGLIQVEASKDRVFSIVKTLQEPSGVQYVLTYQRFFEGGVINIQAFFEETGTTGIRDSVVFELCQRENLVGTEEDPFAGWTKDPYDENFRQGALMNLSEQEGFDESFPGFPLSLCREFIKTLDEMI